MFSPQCSFLWGRDCAFGSPQLLALGQGHTEYVWISVLLQTVCDVRLPACGVKAENSSKPWRGQGNSTREATGAPWYQVLGRSQSLHQTLRQPSKPSPEKLHFLAGSSEAWETGGHIRLPRSETHQRAQHPSLADAPQEQRRPAGLDQGGNRTAVWVLAPSTLPVRRPLCGWTNKFQKFQVVEVADSMPTGLGPPA